jgi:predicted DNA binding CopG/RHH family protein
MAKQSKKLKPIPAFQSEDDEREFWAKADALDYFEFTQEDGDKAPPTKAISMRLPEPMIGTLKKLALAKSMPYQTLARSYIAAGISREQGSATVGTAKARKRKAG